MALRFLYVMDPMERVLVDKDTTFAFQLEGARRGHAQFHCLAADLFAARSVPSARVRPLRVSQGAPHFALGEPGEHVLTDFDVVFMRKDPPFDMTYVFATQLLALVDARRTLVMNEPRGLLTANEKLYALNFPDVIPPSLISQDPARLKAFMAELDGELIVKPLDGAGGTDVFHLREGDRNVNAILEAVTRDGTRQVMGQQYLPAVRDGDKRIIVLDGRPLGGVWRIPQEDETRGNIHVGGLVAPAELTDRDREICAQLAPRLAADGLYFVGLDVIGGYVTEINVTSPTGVQEIDRFDGVTLSADVIDFVERHAPQAGGAAH